jgi:hypothetical protein
MDNNLVAGSLVLIQIHNEKPWIALLVKKENYSKTNNIWNIIDVENNLRKTQIWEKEIIKSL